MSVLDAIKKAELEYDKRTSLADIIMAIDALAGEYPCRNGTNEVVTGQHPGQQAVDLSALDTSQNRQGPGL